MRHNSSHIAETTYDQQAQELTVEFTDGRKWQYHGVPRGAYTQFISSASRGRSFNTLIRDRFDGEEL